MDDAALEFLRKILETPSPSGYEQPVQKLVREYAGTFADRVTTDTHGNVIAVKNPGATVRVMLAGHCDQIGLVVQHIDAEGYLYFQPVGGWDAIQLVGQRMTLWTATGQIGGVIGRKAIHLLTDEERKQVPKLKDLWLDIGAKDKAEVEEVVRIGDPICISTRISADAHNQANSPTMDDKCGLWVVMRPCAPHEGLKN